MAKPEIQAKAIQLRVEQRLSLNEIQKLLPVTKSTLSLWLRPYPLKSEELLARRVANMARRSAIAVDGMPTPQKDHPGSTVLKGEIAELKFRIRAAEKGYLVLKPTTEARYDFVLDAGGSFIRVQVKYCNTMSSRKTSYQVILKRSQRSCRYSGNAARPYSKTEVDLVVVYLPGEDILIALGTDLFDGKANVAIRVGPVKSRTRKDQLFANDILW